MVLCSRDPFLAKVTAYRGDVKLFCWLGTSLISFTVRQRDLLLVWLFDLGTKKVPGLLRNWRPRPLAEIVETDTKNRASHFLLACFSFCDILYYLRTLYDYSYCRPCQFSVTERPTSFPGFSPTSLGTRFLKGVFKNYKRFLSGEG